MINYYKAATDKDFMYIASLFRKENVQYFETKKITANVLKQLSASLYRNDYILLLGRKKIGWFNIRQQIKPKTVGIFGMIIDYPYQRKGYGTTAMKLIEKEAKKLGVKKMRLQVFEQNKVAHKLYKKFGYQETHRLIAMEKKIK